MTLYSQQSNNLIERLPVAEQKFILEFVKKISINYNLTEEVETGDLNLKLTNRKQRKAIDSIIEFLDSVEPLADDPIDEILKSGIELRTPEDLDNL